MKIRFVRPMVYVDFNIWFVYECPITFEPILEKIPASLTLINNNVMEQFQARLEAKYSQTVELEDFGDWYNVKEVDGTTTHPFTKQRIVI